MTPHADSVPHRRPHRRVWRGLLLPVALGLTISTAMGVVSHGLHGATLQQTVILEEQSFEDPTFPPLGWESIDVAAQREESPAQLRWGRETCDAAPGFGDASAWAARGGAAGEGLGCLDPYPGPIFTILSYGPIDARTFAQGLSVNLIFKIDAPTASNLLICAATEEETLACFGTGLSDSAGWKTFQAPGLTFSDAAGMEAVFIEIRYADTLPMEPHFGALVDGVVIRGEGSTGPTATPGGPTATSNVPTATQGPGQTPTATRPPTVTPPASATPTSTATRTVPPTATPSRTPSMPAPTASPTGTMAPATVSPTTMPTGSPTATITTPETPATALATATATTMGSSTSTPTLTLVPPVTEPPPTASATASPTPDGPLPITATPTPTGSGTATQPPVEGTPTSGPVVGRIYLPLGQVPRR